VKRESLVAVLLALLAVVALGVAAATLDTAVTADAGGFGGGDAGSSGPSENGDTPAPTASPGGEIELQTPELCFEALWEPPTLLVFGLVFLGIGLLAYRDTGSLLAGAAVVALIGFPTGLLMYLLSLCRPLELGEETDLGIGGSENGTLPGGGGDGGSGLGAGSGTVSTPEALFVAILVVAMLASLFVLLAASGDDDAAAAGDESAPDEPATSEPDLTAVARTAGEAADRIESETAENEVYQAWREMTAVLDVDRPASSTPAEFATTAVDAGVDEEPVAQLTAVFERVRYGGEDPTDDRERRAVEALRRIEEAHGGDR